MENSSDDLTRQWNYFLNILVWKRAVTIRRCNGSIS